MNATLLNEAAQSHAKEVLGEEQYAANNEAAESIASDFKAGAKWAAREPQPTIELLPTMRVETALGVLTVSHEDIDNAGGFTPWLQNSGYIGDDETEDDITYRQGPLLTREAYRDLPQLN
jgi:hypothetical protein